MKGEWEMIITRLIGGLGNQLFQYAVARHVAERQHTDLKLDIRGFETYALHTYALGAFAIHEYYATIDDVRKVMAIHTVEENKEFVFNPAVLDSPADAYLTGYWQTEKYFSSIQDIIRTECTVKTPQRGRDKVLAEEIAMCESVSIHIRRADYVTDSQTSAKHGTCTAQYYESAIAAVAARVNSPRFFIFSDDTMWAKANLKCAFPLTFIDHNGPDKNYEDLRLMSQCRHNIIANSTFSWWGAWLNTHAGAIKIAPRKWLNNDWDTRDVIPETWMRI